MSRLDELKILARQHAQRIDIESDIPAVIQESSDLPTGKVRVYRQDIRNVVVVNGTVRTVGLEGFIRFKRGNVLQWVDTDIENSIEKFGDGLPAAEQTSADREASSDLWPSKNLKPGVVLPSAEGGLNVRVEYYTPAGLLQAFDPFDLTPDVPASTDEFGWSVIYLTEEGVVASAPSVTRPMATKGSLIPQDALNVVLPDGAYRLFAVSLGNGQTDAAYASSAYLDLRRWLTPEGVATGPVAAPDAADVDYDPSLSGLSATNVQDAIDEVVSELGGTGGNVTVGNYATSRPASPASGDLFLARDGYFDYEVYDSGWIPYLDNFPITLPIDANYAWVNQGSSTINASLGAIALYTPAVNSQNLRIRKKAAPSTPYVVTVAVQPFAVLLEQDFFAFHLLFRESSSGKLSGIHIQANSSNSTGMRIAVQKWTNETTFSASYISLTGFHQRVMYLRIADNGTNRICSISADGKTWLQIHSVGRADFLTADEVGFAVESFNATYDQTSLLLSWKET